MQDHTRMREVTAALVLLLILFLILAAITGVLLKNYLEMGKETSHLRNPDLATSEEMSRLKNEIICTPCPDDWSMSGCSCYFVSEELTSWNEARDKCYAMKSVLVMIKDKAESDTLDKLYQMNKRYWIGLTRDPENATIWKWLDGTQITFNNWGGNNPDNYLNRENCGETRPGSWNDRTCTDKTNFYICKR
ncbi:CD209 antigen-like protein A isoform X2 [Hyla sarda]|uniref:CD209 antigen-like protein A isoform X2 n=1 Tax=Hyla sarda TaxID=327740 RepID=UPI0024C4504F|nr:CD209 antigen-like protein A isoform X2 [Hyla sarda]